VNVVDEAVLSERVAAVERHLARVRAKLPSDPEEFLPNVDATDAVVLHLWQAVQIVIDLAVSACVRLNLGTPRSYREAFERLASNGFLEEQLAERLARAAGFRNTIAHAYESIDLTRVYRAATDGPADLRAFLVRVRDGFAS
jgi:uncharacterized protein YutE (UPF0331/DUF86 family)